MLLKLPVESSSQQKHAMVADAVVAAAGLSYSAAVAAVAEQRRVLAPMSSSTRGGCTSPGQRQCCLRLLALVRAACRRGAAHPAVYQARHHALVLRILAAVRAVAVA